MAANTTEGPAVAPRRKMNILFSLTLILLLLALWVVLGFWTDKFWTPLNITNLARQGSMTAILALGQTFVIITAGIDLSVGAIVGFCTVIVAWLLQAGFPVWAAILITLLFGVLIGIISGFRELYRVGKKYNG